MAENSLASAKAQLASAQAQLISAEQNLTFTNVKVLQMVLSTQFLIVWEALSALLSKLR